MKMPQNTNCPNWIQWQPQVAKETEVSKFIQAAYVYFGCGFAVNERLPSRTLKPNYFLLVVVG